MGDASGQPVSAEVKAKINDISLLLVMSSDQDKAGIDLLCDLFDDLRSIASGDPACLRLLEEWHHVKSSKDSLDLPTFFSLLQELVNQAIIFCERPDEVKFAHEKDSALAASDPLAGVDTAFLGEFIETHRMQLEDFESWILDCEFQNEQGENVDALVKRYVHSLKGDANSIGLVEIGRACHFVEDTLAASAVKMLVEPLLLFKEWVISYVDALTKKETPRETIWDFELCFKEACGVHHPQTSASVVAASSQTSTPPSSPGHEVASYRLSGEKDIFQEFVAEAEEHLCNVESVILDADGCYTKDSVDTIFRGIHSLKGGSAYFTFQEMTETSHLLENLLDEVRREKRQLDQTLTGLVLSYIDLQKGLLTKAKAALASDGVITKSQASAEFLQTLNSFVAGTTRATTESTISQVPPPTRASPCDTVKKEIPAGAANAKEGDRLDVKNFVKVDTARLDYLIDSIGETVIYSSMLIRRCRDLLPDHEDVLSITHRVEKFTRDLQDVGMSMRLVPIKGLFQKMSRLVWDTSKKINKEITVSVNGEDTELDRNLIDKLADPLMHMVRNALDHGVEPPDERERLGKPRVGKVHLSASHSGGNILIRIQDDGRGLDPGKLLAKAIEKGIVAEDQKLTEQEIFQLIFAPGFSTATVVTDISGRGVGMDVVRKNVESLRGRIQIESKVGSGSAFIIELPLTLAIIDGIEVLVGKERLIIPSLAIVEFVKPTPAMLNSTFDRAETFHFRGKYLPIFRLADLYNMEPRYTNPLDATFIVVENHEELVALMVDEIVGELSTVIKSLGTVFSEVKGISGCAVMPNGDAALILDIRSLVQLARSDYTRQPAPNAEHETNAS